MASTTRSGLTITRSNKKAKEDAPTFDSNLKINSDLESLAVIPEMDSLAIDSVEPRITVVRTPVQRPAPKLTVESTDSASIASATRSHELLILKTRYASSHTVLSSPGSDSVCRIQLIPSDPDFPFDLPFLALIITVPHAYPSQISAVRVEDTSIPEELKRGITGAWREKMQSQPIGLLEMVKWVDRNLEDLLIKKKIVFVQQTAKEVTEDKEAEESEETEEEEETQPVSELLEKSPHRGIQVRFPNMYTEHIALLVCKVLSLSIRCLHCKHSFDQHIQPTSLWQSCTQCATSYGTRYRPTYITSSDPFLGYLDLDGVVALDLLPSTYIATCECGCEQVPTASPSSHFKSLVRDWRVEKFCHACHLKMVFKIDIVKFVRLAPSVLEKTAHLVVRRKKPADAPVGGILKDNGTCVHYKRSYRWFRFGCCGKLYPCDICHEEGKGDQHDMIWATRMVCGFCSKEQNYSKDKDCACGHALVKKSSGGYWEGGKGTRDRTLIRRNDPQKHKGLTKTISNKARK